ncbi:flagellar protein FlaG [Novimethylophilus kurashikiensis]|uniref:Flagellar protein FlaG n=1 Tax=Novimethylophilus kurashikiensis TaxID=1825523 RepID=A0A2R5FAQ7_9PROT|nr:flagellar protein FlaG [Novimethylophilus kurashikiensis]GBG14638.1 flagellar protein FlaG [Novimethylophilus kurashikiensis]
MNISAATYSAFDATLPQQAAAPQPRYSPPEKPATAAAAPAVVGSSLTGEQAVKQVNDAFLERQKNLVAAVEKDKLTGIPVFKIMDVQTNEVIRQLPTHAMVSFAQSLAVPGGWRGQLILDQI